VDLEGFMWDVMARDGSRLFPKGPDGSLRVLMAPYVFVWQCMVNDDSHCLFMAIYECGWLRIGQDGSLWMGLYFSIWLCMGLDGSL
jgi:hypothetical protein